VKIDEKNDGYSFYHIGNGLQYQNIAETIMMTYQKKFSLIFMQDSGNNYWFIINFKRVQWRN